MAGFRRKEEKKSQSEWERSRMLMFAMIMPYAKDKKIKPQDLICFPWEVDFVKNSKVDLKTQDELKGLFRDNI